MKNTIVGVVVIAAIVVIIGAVLAFRPKTAVAPTATESCSPTAKIDTTTATGLVITDETVGCGATVKVGDSITVKYTGTLADGTVFDSTAKQGGQPATFTLAQGQLIDGWVQGIPGMKVGGKRKLVIPPSLGYGAQGQGTIPANSTLTFEIELVAVN